jgi:hypothetical protein
MKPDLWGFLWGSQEVRIFCLPKSLKDLVSAAGFEPATHALKGHCSTT